MQLFYTYMYFILFALLFKSSCIMLIFSIKAYWIELNWVWASRDKHESFRFQHQILRKVDCKLVRKLILLKHEMLFTKFWTLKNKSHKTICSLHIDQIQWYNCSFWPNSVIQLQFLVICIIQSKYSESYSDLYTRDNCQCVFGVYYTR